MADSKITALTAITTVNPATYPLVIVDTDDTSMAATGTTKKVTANQLLGAGGTATLASATITGDLTVDTSTLKVDSANNRVLIGTLTALGSATLSIAGKTQSDTAVAGDVIGNFNNSSATGYGFRIGGGSATGGYALSVNNNAGSEFHQISGTGVATWSNVGGVAGTAMTLNSTGLGVGVTPSAWASGNKFIDINSSAAFGAFGSSDAMMIGNAYWNGSSWIRKTANNAWRFVIESVSSTPTMTWQLAANGSAGSSITWTQAMTLDASGILVVGNTAAASVGATGGWLAAPNSGNSYTLIGHNSGSASGSTYTYFFYNSSVIGSITQSGTTGVLYNITSDYRLKESVQPLIGGLARVNALKPSIYKWKSDGSNGEGFLAHELAEVVPAAVSGEKDAVNEDGTIKAQSIDMSRVVPILVAAIQELTARVQTLETR